MNIKNRLAELERAALAQDDELRQALIRAMTDEELAAILGDDELFKSMSDAELMALLGRGQS